MLPVMCATNTTFTLSALGPLVLDGFKSLLVLKQISANFFQEMVSLLDSMMMLLLVIIMMVQPWLPFMQLHMSMVAVHKN